MGQGLHDDDRVALRGHPLSAHGGPNRRPSDGSVVGDRMTMGRRRSPSIRAGRRGQIDPERRPSSIHDPPNHSLRPPGRHTYASLLIHEGRSPQLVAAALGHASGELVWRRYAHVFDEARLAPSVPMVEAIEVARVAVGASVYDRCTTGRSTRPSAPTP